MTFKIQNTSVIPQTSPSCHHFVGKHSTVCYCQPLIPGALHFPKSPINRTCSLLCLVSFTWLNAFVFHPYRCMYTHGFFLFFSEWRSTVGMYYRVLIQSPLERYLNCVHFGAVVNKDAVKILAQDFGWT